jgi:uncharacterized membrane protein
MEPHRQGHRMTSLRSRQRGITILGFLVLAIAFGALGLAGIKLVPVYMKTMKVSSVLSDVERDLSGTGVTPASIRVDIDRRFDIEGISLPAEAIKVTTSRDGYLVQIAYEDKVNYAANLWLMVSFDKSAEIRR